MFSVSTDVSLVPAEADASPVKPDGFVPSVKVGARCWHGLCISLLVLYALLATTYSHTHHTIACLVLCFVRCCPFTYTHSPAICDPCSILPPSSICRTSSFESQALQLAAAPSFYYHYLLYRGTKSPVTCMRYTSYLPFAFVAPESCAISSSESPSSRTSR